MRWLRGKYGYVQGSVCVFARKTNMHAMFARETGVFTRERSACLRGREMGGVCVFARERIMCVCLRKRETCVRVCEEEKHVGVLARECVRVCEGENHVCVFARECVRVCEGEDSGGVFARECVRVCEGTKGGCVCARECVRVCEGEKCVFMGERSGAYAHVCAGEKCVCLRVCVHVCEGGNAGMWQGESVLQCVAVGGTARSVEDETRNGRRNAKRNPNRNHETIFLGLFSFKNLKRDLKR